MSGMLDHDEALDRLVRRAAANLDRPGAYLDETPVGYALRLSPDRRRRPVMSLDERVFQRLAVAHTLTPRPDGGWGLARPRAPARASAPPAGRPGVVEGERLVAEEDGRLVAKRANLGESPIAWLARRRDPYGRPWLCPEEVAAGERLREDIHLAGTLGRLTMTWDAGPRAKGGRGPGVDPAERNRAAKARVAAALEAAGPGLREMLERVCLRGSALDAAERGLGLPRRAGKTVLKLALGRLAVHYGLMR